tara:strand:- start:1327 stop:1920 length:594 start_codon:yes stop_codon:yes gene_type:complete
MLKKMKRGLKYYEPKNNEKIKKRASVLIPLIEIKGEIFVMFTERAKHLRSHPGQVSFPGGKQESRDANALDTALRETYEEIGLHPKKVEILGRLDQIVSLYNYLVTPFVGVIPDRFEPKPNPDEIETVFKVPLSFFMNSKGHWAEEYETQSGKVLIHHFHFHHFDIWGLTAKLILRMLEIGLGHVPEFEVHHPDYPP